MRFVAGYLLGLVGLPLALGLIGFSYAVIRAQLAKPAEPITAVTTYVTSGAELSERGATLLVWRRLDAVLRQSCRGPCDDLVFRYRPKPRLAEADGAIGKGSSTWLRVVKDPLP